MEKNKASERGFLRFFAAQIKDAAGNKDKEAELINEAAKHVVINRAAMAEYLEFCQNLFGDRNDAAD